MTKKNSQGPTYLPQYGWSVGGVIIGLLIANLAAGRTYWMLSIAFAVAWVGMTLVGYRRHTHPAHKQTVDTDERTDMLWHQVSMNLLLLVLFVFPGIFLLVSRALKHCVLPTSWVLIYCVFSALVMIAGYEIVKRQ